MPKVEKELKPEIIHFSENNIKNENDIKKLLGENGALVEIKGNQNDTTDNFFRAVINEMLNDNNIDLKTEFTGINETFASAKLDFMAKWCNMPYLRDFNRLIARKRVSNGRKSRIELIKAFDKRDEELNAQNRIQDLRNLMGVQ
jgi:hypothetical protein